MRMPERKKEIRGLFVGVRFVVLKSQKRSIEAGIL